MSTKEKKSFLYTYLAHFSDGLNYYLKFGDTKKKNVLYTYRSRYNPALNEKNFHMFFVTEKFRNNKGNAGCYAKQLLIALYKEWCVGESKYTEWFKVSKQFYTEFVGAFQSWYEKNKTLKFS
jgi:hypothetical protein